MAFLAAQEFRKKLYISTIMFEFCKVYLIITLQIVSAVDDLEVKYIADVVTQSIKEATNYVLPNNAYEYKPTNNTLIDYGTFDYIIVGAGSAGAVLATRLSEKPNISILLLEAGGPDSTFVNIPSMFGYLACSKYNWNYKTVPQKHSCLGMVNQQCYETRGKGLGGSSLINALMYVRANKYDHDAWEDAGNKGWSYNDVLPYYKKSENSQFNGDAGYHGKGGLLNVVYNRPVSIIQTYLNASIELGQKIVDYNGREQKGVDFSQFNHRNGRRDHTGKAFLTMAQNRPNLKIEPFSYVTQVVIENKRAIGVKFANKRKQYYAAAAKEVVLSAGVIGSPQILMLSGIGPSEHLKSLKIPLVADLPVGKNYQNHPAFWGLFFTTNQSVPAPDLYKSARDFLNGYGSFTDIGGVGVGFIRTPSASTPKNAPNIELVVQGQGFDIRFQQYIHGYTNETFNGYFTRINTSKSIRILIALLKPKSRGTVQLKTSNPYDYPILDPNFLAHEEDIEAIYEAINMVRKLLETKAFRKIDAKLFYKVLPKCTKYAHLSKEQWFCQIKHLSSHLYHPVGTCKMDPNGVVDNELKVYGVKKLRVVDASIIPEAISGHTNAPAIMIAEKIAPLLARQ